jgi:hypothetical protein
MARTPAQTTMVIALGVVTAVVIFIVLMFMIYVNTRGRAQKQRPTPPRRMYGPHLPASWYDMEVDDDKSVSPSPSSLIYSSLPVEVDDKSVSPSSSSLIYSSLPNAPDGAPKQASTIPFNPYPRNRRDMAYAIPIHDIVQENLRKDQLIPQLLYGKTSDPAWKEAHEKNYFADKNYRKKIINYAPPRETSM